MRFLILCVNPSIDITISAGGLSTEAVNTVSSTLREPGGKGVNVARVLRQLRILVDEIKLDGFLCGFKGHELCAHLYGSNIKSKTMKIEGDNRFCYTISLPDGKEVKLNEAGPSPNLEKQQTLLSNWIDNCKYTDFAAISGKPQPSLPDDYYNRFIEAAHQSGVPIFLDTHGPALKHAVLAKPTYLKINQHELAELVDEAILTFEDAIRVGRKEIFNDIELIVTFGEKGAVWISKPSLIVKPPKINLISSVGAGDAFLAGLMHAIAVNEDKAHALAFAAACGASAAEHLSSARINRDRINEFLREIEVKSIG